MNIPNTIYLNSASWAFKVAILISDEVASCVKKNGSCSVLLTGGRAAAYIYQAWANLPSFHEMWGVNFYFGDERCVPYDHADSNYGMTMKTLFQNGIPPGCNIYRINVQDLDLKVAAKSYAEVLPCGIDLLLLSLGDDGHIASMFPGSKLLSEAVSRVLPVSEPSIRHSRISITPVVLQEARKVYIFAIGIEKRATLSQIMISPKDAIDLPARLVLDAIWLIHEPL